jgi:dihydroxy-acid dehydratase
MDVEESIRGNPMDGVVLLVGCDKTTPALLMGAASVDLPTIVVTGGPMLNGKLNGKDIGSGTAVWQLHEQAKGGQITMHDFLAAEAGHSRSAGTCNTMGTASTMACMAESLGTSLPHNAAIPAVDARRYVLAHMSGIRIVEMVNEDLKLSKILKRENFENAIRVNAAIGGSTNAVIHLKAIAGRIGVPLELEDWTKIGKGTPTIVDLLPSGRYLMEEFYYAGGLPGVIRRLGESNLLPHKDALTVNGRTLWENTQDAPIYNDEVIRKIDNPLIDDGGICILRGNLAPRGAVLKPSAASPHLMKHRGKAVVFEDFDHYKQRIVDPDLDVDENSVLVMKNCGPKGYPGMAEVGNMGLPPKLLAKGITDMVRISDARMSGTAYGTVVLHVAPEAMAGGPLGIVKDGDFIELDCKNGRLHLDVSDAEIQARLADRAENQKALPKTGYAGLYLDHVLQADEGCDFDFLVGCRGSAVPKHSH